MTEEKIYSLMPEENNLVERLNYVCQSNKALVSILARELNEPHDKDMIAMLKDASDAYRRSYIELQVAQNAVLNAHIDGPRIDDVHFVFDFKHQEVRCSW